MFGLATRYGRLAGPLGKWSLLLGGLAGLVALTGAMLMALAAGDGWYIWISGFTLLFVGLLVFGVVGWRKQVLERWRAAPILAGLGVPAMLLASVAFQVLDGNRYVSGAVLLIVAGNMFLLGYLLRGVSTRAAALAA